MKSYGVTIRMEPFQQYFRMVLFIQSIVPTFESVDKIPQCYHSKETFLAKLLHRTIHFLTFYKKKFHGLYSDSYQASLYSALNTLCSERHLSFEQFGIVYFCDLQGRGSLELFQSTPLPFSEGNAPGTRASSNTSFPSSTGPLYQNEVKCSAFDIKMIFNSNANKTHFHKKGFELGLILKMRIFRTQKWPIN